MRKGRVPNGTGKRWLHEHVGHTGEACLIWPFCCSTPGYGAFFDAGRPYTAHRYMCILAHGEPPSPDLEAAHSCGNRRCVNPRHLSWKTKTENQLDRRTHGTHGGKGKITPEQAEQIRQLKGVETSIETAAKYGVTESNVRQIQAGTIWLGTHHVRRFSTEEVVEIRKSSMTQDALAEKYGVKRGVIQKIRSGRTYRDVPI